MHFSAMNRLRSTTGTSGRQTREMWVKSAVFYL